MAESAGATASHVTRLPAVPASIPAARHFAVDAADDLGCNRRDDVELLVSELATNAVVHARTQLRLTLCRAGRKLRIEVGDDDPTPPRVFLRPDPLRPGGRGMCLVNSLADDWGVDLTDEGKTVWFELAVRSRPRARVTDP
jgi:anti-sigma regulatory factor (Ser/Thr protein kinase)